MRKSGQMEQVTEHSFSPFLQGMKQAGEKG